MCYAGLQRRRRSSLAQLTDILREWSGSKQQSVVQRSNKAPLNRRETLADLARSLPWRSATNEGNNGTTYIAPRKRRESSADSGMRSTRTRRDSNTAEFVKHWNEPSSSSTIVNVPIVVEGGKGVSQNISAYLFYTLLKPILLKIFILYLVLPLNSCK